MFKKSLVSFAAFESSMGWKKNEDGSFALSKNGNPVYTDSTGQEREIEVDTITRLNAEAKTHRTEKENLAKQLKNYEGLDADLARKAIETVGKIDAKQLIDAGKVDELRNQITQQFSADIAEKENKIKDLSSKIDTMQIDRVFASSDFIRDSIAVPRDMFEASFRNYFKVENGEVVALDKAGNRLMSKSRVGEYADAEEAMRILVESHPQKDVILRANAGSGTGNSGQGGANGGSRVVKRSEFENYPPAKQAELAAKMRSGEIKLTD